MSGVFDRKDISYLAIKSFDSFPDIGHKRKTVREWLRYSPRQ